MKMCHATVRTLLHYPPCAVFIKRYARAVWLVIAVINEPKHTHTLTHTEVVVDLLQEAFGILQPTSVTQNRKDGRTLFRELN